METPRERFMKAIDHVQPDVVPVHIMGFDHNQRWLDHFGVPDNFALRMALGLDVQEARAVYTGRYAGQGLTIFGQSVSQGDSTGAGYSTGRGGYPLAAAATAAEVEAFPWPSPDEFDYDVLADTLRTVPDDIARFVKVQYVHPLPGEPRQAAARRGASWTPLICTVFDLVGIEESLVKMQTEPVVIEAMIARMEEFILGFTRRMLDATRGLADVFYFGDDFATQRGLLISPRTWRRFLKPSYARIFSLARSYGLKVWFHSCGTFRPVLPDLIEIGMDVWETVQVHLPGNEPEVLKREYGRDLAFYGAISTQHTLPFGTPDDVRAEVRQRIRVLGAGGGYICGSDHGILPDVPIENVLAMLDEAKRFRF